MVANNLALILISTRNSTNDFGLKLMVMKRSYSELEHWTFDSSIDIGTQIVSANFVQASHMQVLDSGDNQGRPCEHERVMLNVVFGGIYMSTEEVTVNVPRKGRFFSVLHWFTFGRLGQEWNIRQYQRLVENGLRLDWPKYVHFVTRPENHLCNLAVVSDGRMAFESIIQDETYSDCICAHINMPTPKTFIVSQTEDKICLNMELKENESIIKSSVELKSKELHVQIILKTTDSEQAEICLKGDLEHDIIEYDSGWELIDCDGKYSLSIWLKKSRPTTWNCVVLNNKQLVMDGCQVSESYKPRAKCLESEEAEEFANDVDVYGNRVEDCDRLADYTSLALTHFQCQTGRVLDEYDLSSHQYLFTQPCVKRDQSVKPLPCIVLRDDVDAFVYELKLTESTAEMVLRPEHVATVNAFGFIQASKVNRRFMTLCHTAPGVSHVTHSLIFDSENSVYAYWSSRNHSNDGHSYIFHLNDSLDGVRPLLSMGQSNCRVFIVSKSTLHLLCINPVLECQ